MLSVVHQERIESLSFISIGQLSAGRFAGTRSSQIPIEINLLSLIVQTSCFEELK